MQQPDLHDNIQEASLLECDDVFLADFDFEEIRHVPGADNVVPDFLSRPYNPSLPDVELLHLLTHPRTPSVRSLHALCVASTPSVLILPCQGAQVGVLGANGALRLPGGRVLADESPLLPDKPLVDTDLQVDDVVVAGDASFGVPNPCSQSDKVLKKEYNIDRFMLAPMKYQHDTRVYFAKSCCDEGVATIKGIT